jgi:hypothetical protein
MAPRSRASLVVVWALPWVVALAVALYLARDVLLGVVLAVGGLLAAAVGFVLAVSYRRRGKPGSGALAAVVVAAGLAAATLGFFELVTGIDTGWFLP